MSLKWKVKRMIGDLFRKLHLSNLPFVIFLVIRIIVIQLHTKIMKWIGRESIALLKELNGHIFAAAMTRIFFRDEEECRDFCIRMLKIVLHVINNLGHGVSELTNNLVSANPLIMLFTRCHLCQMMHELNVVQNELLSSVFKIY